MSLFAKRAKQAQAEGSEPQLSIDSACFGALPRRVIHHLCQPRLIRPVAMKTKALEATKATLGPSPRSIGRWTGTAHKAVDELHKVALAEREKIRVQLMENPYSTGVRAIQHKPPRRVLAFEKHQHEELSTI